MSSHRACGADAALVAAHKGPGYQAPTLFLGSREPSRPRRSQVWPARTALGKRSTEIELNRSQQRERSLGYLCWLLFRLLRKAESRETEDGRRKTEICLSFNPSAMPNRKRI